MMKRRKILGLSASCLMLLSLTSCDVKASSKEGYVLTIKENNGELTITADEVFKRYMETKEGVEAAYNQINNAVVRHLAYYGDVIPEAERSELIAQAEASVDDVKKQAQNNADTNKTSYDDELETLLKSNNAENLKELQVVFEDQNFKSYLENKFYDDFLENLKEGGKIKVNDNESIEVDSYINDILPYHVKHLLVKVSASATDYTTSTISEAESIKLSSAITTLGTDTTYSFGIKAQQMSDDSGSASTYGDLGIMSINTSYVNEFKLGIYTYETLFNNSVDKTDETTLNKLNKFLLNDDEETSNYKDYLENKGINFIPSGIADVLSEYAKDTRDASGEDVNDGNESYYPRNIIWNKYLNKHEVSFIELASCDVDETMSYDENTTDDDVIKVEKITPDNASNAKVGDFAVVDGVKTNYVLIQFNGDTEQHWILTDGDSTNPKPILVTRAGTSSSSDDSSGYQGIHFIVVERSALDDKGSNDTTLSQYYTTTLPDENGEIAGLNGKRVYVNTFNATQKDYLSRVNTLKSEIKAADNSIDKKINMYYFELSGAKIIDNDLKKKIDKYIDADSVQDDKDSKSTLVEAWESYYNTLTRESDERNSKLIPLICAIKFNTASTTDKELFESGVCHYVAQKD